MDPSNIGIAIIGSIAVDEAIYLDVSIALPCIALQGILDTSHDDGGDPGLRL